MAMEQHNALDEGRGWIFGQLTSVGVAVSVLLAEHPKRNRLLQPKADDGAHERRPARRSNWTTTC